MPLPGIMQFLPADLKGAFTLVLCTTQWSAWLDMCALAKGSRNVCPATARSSRGCVHVSLSVHRAGHVCSHRGIVRLPSRCISLLLRFFFFFAYTSLPWSVMGPLGCACALSLVDHSVSVLSCLAAVAVPTRLSQGPTWLGLHATLPQACSRHLLSVRHVYSSFPSNYTHRILPRYYLHFIPCCGSGSSLSVCGHTIPLLRQILVCSCLCTRITCPPAAQAWCV
jgi:hypothetical protein